MSNYDPPDFRRAELARTDGISMRGVFLTLGVVLLLFVLIVAIGARTGTDPQGTQAEAPEALAPAIEATPSVPAD